MPKIWNRDQQTPLHKHIQQRLRRVQMRLQVNEQSYKPMDDLQKSTQC